MTDAPAPAPAVARRRVAGRGSRPASADRLGVPTSAHRLGRPRAAADRFERLRDRAHGLLPHRLGQLVPATAVGFAAISSFTYAVDLAVLAALFDVVGVPYPAAVSVGYVTAFGLAFVLNRWLNFRSHGSVARQTARYVLTVVANYALFILLLSSTLEAVGVNYLVARLLAGACEAVFIYLMMRFVVFRAARATRATGATR